MTIRGYLHSLLAKDKRILPRKRNTFRTLYDFHTFCGCNDLLITRIKEVNTVYATAQIFQATRTTSVFRHFCQRVENAQQKMWKELVVTSWWTQKAFKQKKIERMTFGNNMRSSITTNNFSTIHWPLPIHQYILLCLFIVSLLKNIRYI